MKKTLILLLIITLLLTPLAACAQTEGEEPQQTETQSAAPSEQQSAAPEESAAPPETPQGPAPDDSPPVNEIYDMTDDEAIAKAIEGGFDFTAHKAMLDSLTAKYPIVDEPASLSLWLNFETSMLTYIEGNLLDNQMTFVELEKLTGVHINLTVADSSTASEKYNIMVAAEEYPDLIPGSLYTTGLDAAIDDEVIYSLGDIIDQYCPNYKTILDSDPNLASSLQTPDGAYASFSRIKDGVTTPSNEGAFIRMDWLDKLGMDVPVTYDELYETLLAFKTEFGATEPLLLRDGILPMGGLFTGGYGFTASVSSSMGPGGGGGVSGCYQIDGVVTYGAVTEDFREFTLMLRQWYADGLISDNCLTRSQNPFGPDMVKPLTEGQSGMFYNNQPFGDLYNGMSEDPDINFYPVRDVVKNAGDINPFFEEVSLVAAGGDVSITTNCKDIELAAKWIDSLYTPEAYLLINYGIQGETWEYDEEGTPQFILELVDEYPSVNIFMATFTSQTLPGTYAESRLAFTFKEGAKVAFEVWSTDKQNLNALGNKTSLTADELQRVSTISTDILTYIAEHYWKFVTGEEDIVAQWDSYVETINTIGLPTVLETVQTAYDRAYK